jgi:hypothetical protein
MNLLNLAYAAITIMALIQVFYAVRMRRRPKSVQDAIVEDLHGARFWRVAVSRPEHHKRLWKISAIQALGVLVDEGEHLRLRGRWNAGNESFDIKAPKKSTQIAWVDNKMTSGYLAWVQLQLPMGSLMIAADTGLNVVNSREALADLVRIAFPGYLLPENARAEFALEKNRRSMAVIVAVFTLLAFAALDTYVFSNYELIESQLARLLLNPMVLLGAIAIFGLVATGAYRFLAAGKVPARESLGLAALTVVAVALALFPALKRIDQGLAANTSTNYQYKVEDSVVNLAPVDAGRGLPKLRFRKAPEYWAQFPVGSEVAIPLLQGPLGLWQLDHARFDPPVFEFYDKQQTK